MNIYNRGSLQAFSKKHPDCKQTLDKWYHDVQAKRWTKPSEVTRDFNTARAVAGSRIIFNVNRNDYRLIAEINYAKGWLFIKFLGTHSEYDKINPSTVDRYKPKMKP